MFTSISGLGVIVLVAVSGANFAQLSHGAEEEFQTLIDSLGDEKQAEEASAKLATLGPCAHRAVMRLLADTSVIRRHNASYVLCSVGPRCADDLITFAQTKHDDENVPERVMYIISWWEEGGLPAIGKLLMDPNKTMQQIGLGCLTKLGTKGSALLPQTIPLLESKDSRVRASALAAIGACGKEEHGIVDRVAVGLFDDTAIVRRIAASALMDMGEAACSTVVSLLGLLLQENDPDVREAAANAVWIIGVTDGGTMLLIRVLQAQRNRASQPSVEEFLLNALSTSMRRAEVKEQLGRMDKESMDNLTEMLTFYLKSERERARRSALECLETLDRLEPNLRKRLVRLRDKDPDSGVREIASRILARPVAAPRSAPPSDQK